MALDKGTCLRFYKRKDIQEAMVEHAQNKEFSVRYNEAFGKRPDVLTYPKEILDLAMKGVTSFHCSEEVWDNPLELGRIQNKKELDEIRAGWDLVLDIDCKFIDYSKISADLIIRFLRKLEVKDVSAKFSGNKGFHIGVPFQAFPEKINNIPTKLLFPEAARKIAAYIKENIKEELGKKILAFEDNDFSKIKEKVNLPTEDIVYYERNVLGDKVAKLNVEKFLEIDTVLIAPRHLYRMPYSLHEKSGLVSLPIDPDRVLEFDRSMAHPDKILAPMFNFLDRNVSGESATRLLAQAWDFQTVSSVYEQEKKEAKKRAEWTQDKNEVEETQITCPIREEFFPPCIKLLLNGIDDGKKRAVFCLSNFLGKVGWSNKQIEDYLLNWNNEKNKSMPLRDNYIVSQLRYYKPGEKLPPNCNNDAYYKGIGVCKPDSLCAHIKNPVNYTLLRWKDHLKIKEEEEKQQVKEEKRKKREEKQLAKEEKMKNKMMEERAKAQIKEEKEDKEDKALDEKSKTSDEC